MRRQLLRLFLLAVISHGQNITDSEANGLGWIAMDEASIAVFLMGVSSGGNTLEIWAFTDLQHPPSSANNACIDQVQKKEYPPIKNKDLAKELDDFYKTPSNLPHAGTQQLSDHGAAPLWLI